MADYSKNQARIVLLTILSIIVFAIVGLAGFILLGSSDQQNLENETALQNTVREIEKNNFVESEFGVDESLDPETKILELLENIKQEANKPAVINLTEQEIIDRADRQVADLEKYYSELDKLKVINPQDGLEFSSPDDFYWYPNIDEEGPNLFTEGRSSGFAKSEEGAALAAIHIFYRVKPFNETFRENLDEQTIGSGKAAYKIKMEAMNRNLKSLEDYQQIEAPIGWDIISYDDSDLGKTTINVYYGFPVTKKEFSVTWKDSDWKLIVPADANFDSEYTSQIPSGKYFGGVFR